MSDKGPHQDPAYGIKQPVNLTHVWRQQRARVDPVSEFNDLDRNWRKQYLADKKLTLNDGNKLQVMRMPEYQKARYNIFRRIGRFPLDMLENAMIKGGMQLPAAMMTRRALGSAGKFMIVVWTVVSLFSDENINNWEGRHTAKFHQNKPVMNPDSKYYADMKAKHVDGKQNPDDFYDNGFRASPLYK